MDADRPRSVMPALVTPLTPERELDEDGVRGLLAQAVRDGASGVLVAGSTGEGALLEPEQRARLTRCARDTVDELTEPDRPEGGDERALVIAGASGQTVAGLRDDVSRLAAAGADRVLVLAPATYPLAPDELAGLHVDVAEDAEAPTLVYHIPQLTGSALTEDTVRDLATHPRIVGMKDSSPDADRRARFVAATRSQATFEVLTGHAPTLLRALDAGAAGSITAVGNVRLRQVLALHEAAARGDEPRAQQLQQALTRLSEAIAAMEESAPAVLKAALQLDGLIAERWCRPPLGSVPGSRLDRVRTALMP